MIIIVFGAIFGNKNMVYSFYSQHVKNNLTINKNTNVEIHIYTKKKTNCTFSKI